MTQYQAWKLIFGVLATIGLYSVLYRETKFYRFFEHVFLGLAVGWSMVAFWTETLAQGWWDKMVGIVGENGAASTGGNWLYAILLPIGLMGYFVYSKKHNWISRIPIGILLGLWSGQQVQVWWTQFGPQIKNAIRPVLPTTFSSITVPSTTGLSPEEALKVTENVYPTQALSNIVYVVTLLSVLAYFLFSFEGKNKAYQGVTKLGRWMMMVGFGAIFGSTVMARFTLLVDRLYFILVEFLQDGAWKHLF